MPSLSDASLPLLTISNTHAASCGTPPAVTNGAPSRYVGYFSSEHGDQWLFLYDRTSRRAILRSGDLGWDREVTFASLTELSLTLTESERQWVAACWTASTLQ